MKRMILAVLIAALPLENAMAQQTFYFRSGNNLLSDCMEPVPRYCLGYIVGLFDALSAVTSSGGSISGWKPCLPKDVTQGQVKDVVAQWLQRNPEKRHFAAVALVAQALAEAFPCP